MHCAPFVQAARLSADSRFAALLSSPPDEAALPHLPHQCAILGTCTCMTQGNHIRGTAHMTSKFVHCLFRNIEIQLHTFETFSFETRRYACGLFSVSHCSTPRRMPGTVAWTSWATAPPPTAASETHTLILVLPQYANAHAWYKNLDKLVHYAAADGRLNVFYSSPEAYVSAKHSYKEAWPLKTDDFFPYADCPHCYWTGGVLSAAAVILSHPSGAAISRLDPADVQSDVGCLVSVAIPAATLGDLLCDSGMRFYFF